MQLRMVQRIVWTWDNGQRGGSDAGMWAAQPAGVMHGA